jgi:hypothetical protein
LLCTKDSLLFKKIYGNTVKITMLAICCEGDNWISREKCGLSREIADKQRDGWLQEIADKQRWVAARDSG